MSFSVTRTLSSTFTIVHARHLASKVAADLHLCASYYGQPPEDQIRDFAEELTQYLNEGYLHSYEFGYQKDNRRLVSWYYAVDENGLLRTDDRAGKVMPYADVSTASFFNFLNRNARFSQLTSAQQSLFEGVLPIQRTAGSPPADGAGYWTSDRNYYAGGCGLGRKTFQPYL